MSTVTKERKRVKAKLARSARLGAEFNGVRTMLLTVGHLQTGYYLSRLQADFGQGFRMEKFACDGGDVYDVNLDAAAGQHSCTCKGNTYHGHCKHVEALETLRTAGKL
jgi:hypothetical protein